MYALRCPRMATTTLLLCAHLLSQGCQSRLNTISEESVSSDPFSSDSDLLAYRDSAPAARSRARSAPERHQRSASSFSDLAFGPEAWRDHFGAIVGDVPSLPSDIEQLLDGSCPFWPDKQVRETHLLVLVPSKVNGVPYTLNKLGDLIRPQFPDNAAGYHCYSAFTSTQLGSVSPQSSCWVLLARDVIPGSRCQDYETQKELVADYSRRTGLDYCLPSALEASTAVLAHYVRSRERLLPDGPWLTYTRCQDLVSSGRDHYPAVVGSFGSAGLHVTNSHLYIKTYNPHGVSCCRKWGLASRDGALAARLRARYAFHPYQRPVSALPDLAFGPEAWCAHFGVAVGNVPSLPSDIEHVLDCSCPFWPDKPVRETHVLVLVPAKVDDVPYTLNKLGELIWPRFPDNEAGYRCYDSNVSIQLGSVSPQASCWVLLTRHVIPGSRCQDYETQKELVADYSRRTGLDYRLPSALEASTAVLAHYVRSGERLFAADPWIYTRCQDLVASGYGHRPVVVGGFGSAGLDVTNSHIYINSYDLHGVLCCRQLY